MIETSRSLCVQAKDIRGRSSAARARSRVLRLRESAQPADTTLAELGPTPSAESGALRVECETAASGLVVRVTGDIDMATVPALASVLQPHLDAVAPGTDLAVDLSGVTFIGLHGVDLLSTAAETVQARGATFHLSGSPPRLQRLLLLTGTGPALGLR